MESEQEVSAQNDTNDAPVDTEVPMTEEESVENVVAITEEEMKLAITPEKTHFSKSHFVHAHACVAVSRIKKYDPYRLVTEEGKHLLYVLTNVGVQRIINSIARVGVVEDQFRLWVIPEPWLQAAPEITIESCEVPNF